MREEIVGLGLGFVEWTVSFFDEDELDWWRVLIHKNEVTTTISKELQARLQNYTLKGIISDY